MTGRKDGGPQRFARRTRTRNAALLASGAVALILVGGLQAGAQDWSGGILSWAAAIACGNLGWKLWSIDPSWDGPGATDGARTETSSAAPELDPSASTWWFWVRPRLTTTKFELGDDHGEWLGDFDRHGPLGHSAHAQDPDHARIDLTLGNRTAHPAARAQGEPIAEIEEAGLRVGGRWLRIDLPRDGLFACAVHDSNLTLLRVTRATDGPFARVQVSGELPERHAVTLLVLFVLTCDHDLANSIGGTLGTAG